VPLHDSNCTRCVYEFEQHQEVQALAHAVNNDTALAVRHLEQVQVIGHQTARLWEEAKYMRESSAAEIAVLQQQAAQLRQNMAAVASQVRNVSRQRQQQEQKADQEDTSVEVSLDNAVLSERVAEDNILRAVAEATLEQCKGIEDPAVSMTSELELRCRSLRAAAYAFLQGMRERSAAAKGNSLQQSWESSLAHAMHFLASVYHRRPKQRKR